MNTPLELVLSVSGSHKRSGRNHRVRCPGPNHANGDKNPSLDIAEGFDGRVLFNCRSGNCSAESIVSAWGLQMKDTFPQSSYNEFKSRLEGIPSLGKRPLARAATVGTSTAVVRTADQIEKRLIQADEPVIGRRASEIEIEPVTWLWPGFIPLGMYTLIDGEEDSGKSFVTHAITASVTRGRGLYGVPAETHIPASNVLLIATEDPAAQVINPRLEMMGTDMERVVIAEEPIDLSSLAGVLSFKRALYEYTPRLVVFDPIFACVGGIDLNQDNQIRTITSQLKSIAEEFNCAIVGIRHIGKSKGMGVARNAGLNGVGWRASSRSNLLIGKNPEDERDRAIAQTKFNLIPDGKRPKPVGYVITNEGVQWTGESTLTVEQMLSMKAQETHDERSSKEMGIEFLKTRLKDGRVEVKVLISEAKSQLGISESTLIRAKNAIDVKAVKPGFGTGWAWELPQQNLPARKKSGISVTCECGQPKQIVGDNCERCNAVVTDPAEII